MTPQGPHRGKQGLSIYGTVKQKQKVTVKEKREKRSVPTGFLWERKNMYVAVARDDKGRILRQRKWSPKRPCKTKTITRTVKRKNVRFDIYGKRENIMQIAKQIRDDDLIPIEQFQRVDADEWISRADYQNEVSERGEWTETEVSPCICQEFAQAQGDSKIEETESKKV